MSSKPKKGSAKKAEPKSRHFYFIAEAMGGSFCTENKSTNKIGTYNAIFSLVVKLKKKLKWMS
jgi:hypothetical protein